MAMIDLTLSPDEAKEEAGYPEDSPENLPKYPYGLCLYLDTETLEKLGLDATLPIGTQLNFSAQAIVTGTSQRQSLSGENYQSMDVQITSMDMGTQGQKSDAERAESLYGTALS